MDKISVINNRNEVELVINIRVNNKEEFIKNAKVLFRGIDLYTNDENIFIIKCDTIKMHDNDRMMLNTFIMNSIRSGIIGRNVKELLFPSNIVKKINKLVVI